MSRAERLQGHAELITQLANMLVQLVSVAGVIAGTRRCGSGGGCRGAPR